MPTLSIIIPLYNEASTIVHVLNKIREVELVNNIEKEIIVVNDASTDDGARLVKEYQNENPKANLRLINHEQNTGKGGAIHTGIAEATGEYTIIQDSDLEYDPRDYNNLLKPLIEDRADIVYGSRFVGGQPHRILFFWHSLGNRLLTFCSNMFTNLNLTDMEIGYKLFRTDILKTIPLVEKRFGFEPEITAKIARIPGIRIYEVGISYYGRTYDEGKKINWRDGLRAFYAIFRYNVYAKKDNALATEKSRYGGRESWLIPLLFFVAGLILMFTAKGTADEGDSIMHYLYARHAYQYPDHFFNHWAKPLFVFCAAPFAQLGFNGMKLFNLLLSTGTLWLTYKMSKELKVSNPWLAALSACFAPYMMIISLSGLTEPMFAFWMSLGIYWLIKKRYFAGFLWLSFLPFVRSEGLIILSVIVLYVLFKRLWRYIPVLAVGHIFYSVTGYFVHKDFLWIFNKMTYAHLSSAYGHGYWGDFYRRMPEVIGKVLCLFLVLGLVFGAIRFAGRFLFKERAIFSDEELFLVYGIFAVYFVGHSAFWALGIFNSFGLIRVMMAILPLAGIICARGINMIAQPLGQSLHTRAFKWLCAGLIILFPFSTSVYAFKWKRDFGLKADQVAEDRLSKDVKQNFPDYKKYQFYYEPVYLSVSLDLNYFDTTEHRRLLNAFEENRFPSKCFVIWDDWFAPVEGHVDSTKLSTDSRFGLLGKYEEVNFWGATRTVKLYRKKD